jgi:4-nitrophenyl phosphatase
MTGEYSIRALILDMDGVLWRGDEQIGDLPWIFDRINQRGLKFSLVTNNATRTPDQYVQKLRGFGVDVSTDHVINSAQATAHYLLQKFPEGGSVFVIGEEGLVKALAEKNFVPAEEDVKAVVVGLDRTLTYRALSRASMLIREGFPFLATNPDPTLPSPEGLIPGAGSILAALEAATGVKPVVIGKPQPEMYRLAIERMGSSVQETLVVGDRLETDIAGGQALGCPTAVVLTGASSEEEAWAWEPPPDIIASDLTNLVQLLT